jgi:hypothetical protein
MYPRTGTPHGSGGLRDGLDDFGSDDFVPASTSSAAPCERKPGSTEPGSWRSRCLLTGLLRNRLLLEDLITRHPEILT